MLTTRRQERESFAGSSSAGWLLVEPGEPSMATSLLELMEELLQSIEQRDSGDPDAPAWEACARIARLEDELAQRLASGETDIDGVAAAAQAQQAGGALAGV
jgi:hypothetical protein